MEKYTKRKSANIAVKTDIFSSSIIQLVHDAIIVVDEDQEIILFNQGAEQIFKYNASEVIGQRLDMLLPLQVSDFHGAYVRSFAKDTETARLMGERKEISGRRKNGAIFPAEASIAKVSNGGKIFFTAILRDITERKIVEQALRESEEKQSMVLNGVDEIIYQVNYPEAEDNMANGTVEFVSERTQEILGYRPTDFIADPNHWFSLIHPEDTSTVQSQTASIMKTGQPSLRHYRIKDINGEYRWMEDRISPEKDKTGRVVRTFGVVRDITERKQAEEALRSQETRFRALIENSADAIVLISADGKILYESPSVTRVLGYAVGERTGRAFFEFVHPNDLPDINNRFAQLLQQPSITIDTQLRIQHKDGSWRWMEGVGQNLLADPSVQAIVANYRDITERKRAEAERAQLLNVLESSLNEIYIFDAETLRFQYVNQGALRNLGYTRKVMSVMTPLDLKPEFEQASFRDLIIPLLRREKEKLVFQTVHRRADGSLYPVEVHLQMSDFEEKHVFHAIILDITERKQAEEENIKLYNAVEQSGDIIFITDRNGMIEYVNPTFETITGYSKEESIGKLPSILSSGLMKTEHYQKIWETILLGEVFREEIIDRKKSGEIFHYDQTITPLKDARGNISNFVSTGKDVTERKRAEDEISLHLSELEVLYQSSLALNQLLKPKEIAQNVIDLLDQELDWHHTTIRLYHPVDETLELLAFNQPGLRSEQEKRAVEERFKTSIAKKGQGLSGWVVEHRQNVRTSDLMHDTRYVETFPGLQSGLYVPIIIGKQIIGVISIESEEADAFSEANERLVATLAAQAASALEHARLFEETEHRLKRLQSLHAIDKAITGSMDISLILDVIIGQAISQLDVDAAVILLYDQTAEALKYAKGSGFRTEALQHTCLPMGDGYAGRVALGRQMVQIPDLQTRNTDFLRSPTFSQEEFVSYIGVPLIANGEIKGVLEVFHRAAFKAETDWLNFLEALAAQTAIAIDNATLIKDLQFSNLELNMAYDATIAGWSRALDLRDKETEGHTLRVTEMTVRLAQAMDINESEIIHIRRGALLHDIGKMGVQDGILLKPDKLTDEEWVLMKKHPQFAYDMLAPIAYLKPALDVPYCHHEKWDGTGYPQGLKGEQIPLAARIFAMADVYDALTSDRPYRKAWSKEKTMGYIREQSGTHFDPQLAEVFMKVVGNFEERQQ